MIFTEAGFFFFFAVAFAVYWAMAGHTARKAWLLLCSYVFYGSWNWNFLWLIVLSTGIDYGVGLGLARTERSGPRRALLGLSLAVNLGMLGLFKYYDFFITSGAGLLQTLGFEVEPRTLGLVLPVGISFYTFQTLSYTIDVFRRRMAPHRSLLDFALFVGFFPQLVAGPIVRAIDFVPQLKHRKWFADVDVRACITLFLFGFIKKACVSDNLAPIVDDVFSDPAAYTGMSRLLGVSFYSVQLYCDFSGYSDMAIATAGLLGFRLPDNFRFPYMATSLTDLWGRWHITLATWFRDYLYIPLGGNRGGHWFVSRNIMAVFLFSGLWHGAAWPYVVWGVLHGFALIIERLQVGRWLERRPFLVRYAYTQALWLLTLAVFRSPTVDSAWTFLSAPGGEGVVAHAGLWWAVAIGFYLIHWMMGLRLLERFRAMPDWGFALATGVAVGFVLPFVQTEYQPFIYFQF